MRISYDASVDALYVRFVDEAVECTTRRLDDAVALDFGPDERLVGIEILDARERLGHGQVPQLSVSNVPVRVA